MFQNSTRVQNSKRFQDSKRVQDSSGYHNESNLSYNSFQHTNHSLLCDENESDSEVSLLDYRCQDYRQKYEKLPIYEEAFQPTSYSLRSPSLQGHSKHIKNHEIPVPNHQDFGTHLNHKYTPVKSIQEAQRRKFVLTEFKLCRFCSHIFTSSVRLRFHIDARHRIYTYVEKSVSAYQSSDSIISSILSSPKNL